MSVLSADERGVKNGNSSILTPVKASTQKKLWFFTWNNYNVRAFEQILLPKLEAICEYAVINEEIGKKCKTVHLQGQIKLLKRARWSEFTCDPGIRWFPTRNEPAAIEYCQKEETSTGKHWEIGVIPPDLRVAIPKRPLKVIKVLRPWQKTIEESCLSEPDDRTINWIYDEKGGIGKTAFCKYMNYKHGCLVSTITACKDVSCYIANLVDAGKDLNEITSMFFNISRDTAEKISYKIFENVKDGLLTSPKFDTQTMNFNPPHLWIFANELPLWDKLSEDRWAIWIVDSFGRLCKADKNGAIGDVEITKDNNCFSDFEPVLNEDIDEC